MKLTSNHAKLTNTYLKLYTQAKDNESVKDNFMNLSTDEKITSLRKSANEGIFAAETLIGEFMAKMIVAKRESNPEQIDALNIAAQEFCTKNDIPAVYFNTLIALNDKNFDKIVSILPETKDDEIDMDGLSSLGVGKSATSVKSTEDYKELAESEIIEERENLINAEKSKVDKTKMFGSEFVFDKAFFANVDTAKVQYTNTYSYSNLANFESNFNNQDVASQSTPEEKNIKIANKFAAYYNLKAAKDARTWGEKLNPKNWGRSIREHFAEKRMLSSLKQEFNLTDKNIEELYKGQDSSSFKDSIGIYKRDDTKIMSKPTYDEIGDRASELFVKDDSSLFRTNIANDSKIIDENTKNSEKQVVNTMERSKDLSQD